VNDLFDCAAQEKHFGILYKLQRLVQV